MYIAYMNNDCDRIIICKTAKGLNTEKYVPNGYHKCNTPSCVFPRFYGHDYRKGLPNHIQRATIWENNHKRVIMRVDSAR